MIHHKDWTYEHISLNLNISTLDLNISSIDFHQIHHSSPIDCYILSNPGDKYHQDTGIHLDCNLVEKCNFPHLPSWDTGKCHHISYCLEYKFENHNETHVDHKLDWLNKIFHHYHHHNLVLHCIGHLRVQSQLNIDCWRKDDFPNRTDDKSRDFHLNHQNNHFFHHIFCSILCILHCHKHILLLGNIWEVLQWMYHNIMQSLNFPRHHIRDIKMPRIFRETLVS